MICRRASRPHLHVPHLLEGAELQELQELQELAEVLPLNGSLIPCETCRARSCTASSHGGKVVGFAGNGGAADAAEGVSSSMELRAVTC